MFARVFSIAIAALAMCLIAGHAMAQALAVEPVTIRMAPGQLAATVTVTNKSDSETSFQLRGFAWTQNGDEDQLSPTDQLLASPPLGSIAAGGSQVVRIVLRRGPADREATFRILFDQIPPPAPPGTVRIALRLSIPVFAQPAARAAPHLNWRIERENGQGFLVAVNDGGSHEAVRGIALSGADGSAIRTEDNQSPYVLAGATRRWRLTGGALPPAGATLRLSAQGDTGTINETVPVGR